MRQLINRFIPSGTIVLSVTTLCSYILGLVRDRTFAHTFGASVSLDSYNAAFLIPDFAFNVLVASGIAAAVVPLFMKARQQGDQAAYVYMNSMMTLATIVMGITGGLIWIGAPLFSHLVAPGLSVENLMMVTYLMRIVALSPIFFAISNALGAMLIAQKRFLWYGLSPVVYNLGIIGGSVLLAPRFGIAGVAYGTVCGALLHMLIRVFDALRSGWRPLPLIQFPIPHVRHTLRLMAPKMIGHPVELLTFWVFTSLASLLAAGSISVLNFARNFQSVPVSIIGIAMATAVFPSLAQAALVSSREVRQVLHRTTKTILFLSTLAAVFLFVIRRPLVALLLGGGAFTSDAIERTALVLGVFCLAIPTESLSHLFARAFYATHNTSVPVLFSVISLVASATSAYVLMQAWGIVGLPLGFFIGSLLKTVGLWLSFGSRLATQKLTPQ